MKLTILPAGRVVHEALDFGWNHPRYGWAFRLQTKCGKPVHPEGYKRERAKVSCKACLSCCPEYWEWGREP